MTNEDRATSYRVLRRRLFLFDYTHSLDADEESLRTALLQLPHAVADLCPIVGADGLWAAMQVLGRPDPSPTPEQAWHELWDAVLAAARPYVMPALNWLTRQLGKVRE